MSTARTLTPDTRAVEELIVERAKLSYARLPMLEVVFDRFALSLAQTSGVKSDASAAKRESGSPEKAAGQAEFEGAVVHVDGAAASGGICRFAVRLDDSAE